MCSCLDSIIGILDPPPNYHAVSKMSHLLGNDDLKWYAQQVFFFSCHLLGIQYHATCMTIAHMHLHKSCSAMSNLSHNQGINLHTYVVVCML